VPPAVGERGFSYLVNPGRGAAAGRGAYVKPGRGAGRGSGGSTAPGADEQQAQQPTQQQGTTQGQQQQGGQEQQRHQGQGQQRQQQQRGGDGGGRGPKAVYKDRQRDEQDPDYIRGVSRWVFEVKSFSTSEVQRVSRIHGRCGSAPHLASEA
jgi:hypothetical protein